MWVIRIRDFHSRYEQFVREAFYDGSIIFFDHEEDAVRLAVLLTQTTQEYLGVQCVAQRFSQDPRKERRKRIQASQIPTVHASLLFALGVS